jgi:hypothetical protein
MFGDSHCRIFFRKLDKINSENITFYNKYQSKVSIRGLINKNSKLKYRNYIIDTLKNLNINTIVCLKLGQIDLEYVYYYKKFVKKQNINLLEFIDETLEIYMSFIKEIKNMGFRVIIISPNLPNPKFFLHVIQESIGIKIKIEYIDLCNTFNIFNEKLENYLRNDNIDYFNIFPIIGTKELNNIYTLKDEFIGLDHHLKGGEYFNILDKQNSNYGIKENNLFIKSLNNYIRSLKLLT